MAFARCCTIVALIVITASRLDAIPLRSHIVDLEEAPNVSLLEDSIPIWYAEENEISSGGELIEEDIIPSANILQLIVEGKEKEAQSNDVVETTVPNEASERVMSRSKRSVILGSSMWPGGVVHYAFSPELRQKGAKFWRESYKVINKAMNMIEDKSCVRFEPYSQCKRGSPCDRNFITFLPVSDEDPHCSSMVGRQLGIQPVRVGPLCYYEAGSVVHELLHSLGFYHEHSRPDRDDHIQILWQNVKETDRKNFEKYTHGNVESFNVSYDLDSIMHYSNYVYSKTGQDKTIIAKNDPNKVLGQRKAMSPSDIKQLNLLYKCPAIDNIPIRCSNVSNQPLLYHQKISMQFKARKWLSCDEVSCKRKSCRHLSKDSDCSSQPTGCKTAKFNILPVQKDNHDEVVHVMNGDQVRIANSEDLFSGKTLHCAMEDPHQCRFDTCAPGNGEVCKNNTFTVRKQSSVDGDVINQNDIISLCQKESGTGSQYCLSCLRISGQIRSPCRLVSCPVHLKECLGVFFRARVWPSF